MKPILALLLLAATPAQAADCKLPRSQNEELIGVIDFAKCILAETEALRQENAALRADLEALEKRLADFPGELQNRNGRVTRTGGDRLTRASLTLASRASDGLSTLPLDAEVIADLCQLSCGLTLSLIAEGLRDSDATPIAALGPCAFSYTPNSGDWTLRGCGDMVTGTDGNGLPAGETGGEAMINLNDTCLLADSEPVRTGPQSGGLGHDRALGLYLIANPAAWTRDESRFHCALQISR